MVHSLDPRDVALIDGALSMETNAGKAALRNIGLNLVTLPSEFLHTLQAGVNTELRAREQRALSMISEQKFNSEQIFIEKIVVIDT